MISSTHHLTPQPAPANSVTKEFPGATASKDIKFGDTFRTISYPVVSEEILERANMAIDSDSDYFVADTDRSFLRSSLRSRLCSVPVDHYNKNKYALGLIKGCVRGNTKDVVVKFDRNCQITDSRNLLQHLNTTNEALIELTKKGLEVLARQFSLHGCFMNVDHVYIIRNFMPCEGSIVDNEWGRNTGQYTLRMQMNDDSAPKENSSYYKGGGLETGELAGDSLSTGKYPNKKTVERHGPVKNGGHVFSNIMHKLIHKSETADYVSKKDGKPLEQRLFVATMSLRSRAIESDLPSCNIL